MLALQVTFEIKEVQLGLSSDCASEFDQNFRIFAQASQREQRIPHGPETFTNLLVLQRLDATYSTGPKQRL